MKAKIALIATAVAAFAALAAGIAVAAGGGNDDSQSPASVAQSGTDDGERDGEAQDSEAPVAGSPAEKAAEAALAATGGGTVLEVERGDAPDAAYEVEVRTSEGRVVEVTLDASFTVLATADDD